MDPSTPDGSSARSTAIPSVTPGPSTPSVTTPDPPPIPGTPSTSHHPQEPRSRPVQVLSPRKRIRLMDGGFSTALKDRGFDPDEPGKLFWTGEANRHRPDLVLDIYKQWIMAGSDIVTTNTYHTIMPLFKSVRRETEIDDYNKPAIKMLTIAITELKPRKKIETWASMGCYGATKRDASEYTGNYVEDENSFTKMMEFYTYETDKLEAYGYRRIIIETVPAFQEARAIRYMMEISMSVFTVCFTCKDGEYLRHGERFANAIAEIIDSPKLVGIGINCTEYPYITPLLKSIEGKTRGKEVFVYPNSGFKGGPNFCDLDDEQLRAQMKEWIVAGATVIGGCCGVGVPQIRRMRKALDYILTHQNHHS